MKKIGYVYKLMSKYRKHPEVLLNYGFQYFEDDNKENGIFAFPLVLSESNPLFNQCILFMEKMYEEATSEEREKDFKDFEFKLELQPDQNNKWRLVLTEDLKKEFSQAQLCVSVDKRVQDSTFLFVNSPIQNAYYNAKTIEECAKEVIGRLLTNKIIYKKKYRYAR